MQYQAYFPRRLQQQDDRWSQQTKGMYAVVEHAVWVREAERLRGQ